MKKLSAILMMVIAMLVATPNTYAQKMTKEQKQAMKTVKKDAKKLEKEGWTVAPGLPGIETQLKESYAKALERDENGYDKFIMGEAMSTAENYDAGLFQATNLAKLDLAGKIQTDVIQLIHTDLGNKQLTDEQAASLVESAAASKNLVAQKLSRVITPVKMFRKVSKGIVEVRTVIYYNHDMAMEAMKASMREDLEKKAGDLGKQIDKILGF